MKVFVAGATGAIGSRLLPLLVAEGHEVTGMTRSEAKAERLVGQGVAPLVLDVFERDRVVAAVTDLEPDVIIHELTDLPDDASRISEHTDRNARIRREGTDNLIAAARESGTSRFLAQSIAWQLEGSGGEAVAHLEGAVLDFGGTVLRYGQLYGPGTFHEDKPPPPPRIQVDEAARRTIIALDAGPGIVEITETANESPGSGGRRPRS